MKISKQVKFLDTAKAVIGQTGDVIKLKGIEAPLLVLGYSYNQDILMAIVYEFKMSKYAWLTRLRLTGVLIRYVLGL